MAIQDLIDPATRAGLPTTAALVASATADVALVKEAAQEDSAYQLVASVRDHGISRKMINELRG